MLNSDVKLIAFYLPQYHFIPENDEFWGKGFTDWVAVKRAKPLYKDHMQPRIPLDNNYYDLSLKDSVAWQAKLAKNNGIYGFGIYHYWFNNEKNLLTKPAQIILENKDIDINYFYAWDNASWKRSWSNVKEGNDWAPLMENPKKRKNAPSILIPYIIGEEKDWRNHYRYLYTFFKDNRYIKIAGKPVFMILHYSKVISEMCNRWNLWAKEDGFEGMFFIFKYDVREKVPQGEYKYKYEPNYSGWLSHSTIEEYINKVKRRFCKDKGPRIFQYDKIWRNIIRSAQKDTSSYIYHGCFVSYDDSPRRGQQGTIVEGSSPEKFKEYLNKLIAISRKQNKEFVFLTAWNEWGEGAYLEPDTINKQSFLSSIRDILKYDYNE